MTLLVLPTILDEGILGTDFLCGIRATSICGQVCLQLAPFDVRTRPSGAHSSDRPLLGHTGYSPADIKDRRGNQNAPHTRSEATHITYSATAGSHRCQRKEPLSKTPPVQWSTSNHNGGNVPRVSPKPPQRIRKYQLSRMRSRPGDATCSQGHLATVAQSPSQSRMTEE